MFSTKWSSCSGKCALLRKSDSFRSPKSKKLEPGKSLSAGKGSRTASITGGAGEPSEPCAGLPQAGAGVGAKGLRATARGGLGAGAPGARRAFSRLLLRLLPGHSWLPWGARGWG